MEYVHQTWQHKDTIFQTFLKKNINILAWIKQLEGKNNICCYQNLKKLHLIEQSMYSKELKPNLMVRFFC